MSKPNLIISLTDRDQLQTLINSARLDSRVPLTILNGLEGELARAEVVSQWEVPADVVTMNSLVTFVDLTTNEEESYTIVYPRDADLLNDKISIFAPVATALLGYRVGDIVEWAVPAGTCRLKILTVENPAVVPS